MYISRKPEMKYLPQCSSGARRKAQYVNGPNAPTAAFIPFISVGGISPPYFNRSFSTFIFSITFTYIIKSRKSSCYHILY